MIFDGHFKECVLTDRGDFRLTFEKRGVEISHTLPVTQIMRLIKQLVQTGAFREEYIQKMEAELDVESSMGTNNYFAHLSRALAAWNAEF